MEKENYNKEGKCWELPIICSPKKIEYYAESKKDAIKMFLEENPAFDENDIDLYDISQTR